MITTEDILNMNFYKKEKFTGSYLGMRYLLKKETISGEDGQEQTVFRCFTWPGPYNFETTAKELIESAEFPFTEEGKQQAADYLNQVWSSRKEWPSLRE